MIFHLEVLLVMLVSLPLVYLQIMSLQDTRLFGTGISAGKSLSVVKIIWAVEIHTSILVYPQLLMVLTSTDTTITLSSTEGFRRGDYCIINGEIVRFTNDNINNILRGQFGTLIIICNRNYY